MKMILRILLFPFTLALGVVVAVCRFACHVSGAVLGGASSIAAVIAVLALVLLRDKAAALNAGIIAFVVSPYGVPKLAEWMVDRLDDLNCLVKSI